MLKFWLKFHIQNLWYSFTRDGSLLQTHPQSLTWKRETPSLSTSRYINNITALMGIFFSIVNCTLANQKNSNNERIKRFLKVIICHQKSNKKIDRLCMKFSSAFNTSVHCRNLANGGKLQFWKNRDFAGNFIFGINDTASWFDFTVLEPRFFWIGLKKRSKKLKFSKLIRQNEASIFSLACYFLWPFFVSLIIPHWLLQ